MGNGRKRIAFLLYALIVLTATLGACSNQKDNIIEDSDLEETDSTDTTENKLKGSLTMAGSTSMEKLSNAVAESFMIKYPNVILSPEFIGSSAGVEAVLKGTVNIGNASRGLKDSEKSDGAVENIVAIDGIAVILDSLNKIDSISKEQLVQIYTGEVNNWSAIGGEDQPIVVVGRESGSGTRGAFEELLEIEDKCRYANEINSTGGVMAKVSSIPGAIGYVSIDVLNETVIAAKIDGIAPTEENIKAGSYLLSRPFVMATYGEISVQNELVKTFFDYMRSEEGKKIIKSVGLITID